MIDSMPRPRPPNLQREITRHGKPVWYLRVGKGKRVRIPGEYGSPEFMAAYDEAISGRRGPVRPSGPTEGSFGWALGLFGDLRPGPFSPSPRGASARPFSAKSRRRMGPRDSWRGSAATSSPGATSEPTIRMLRATSCRRCAACSSGRWRPASLASIRRRASRS
jgi:hypothetical protein